MKSPLSTLRIVAGICLCGYAVYLFGMGLHSGHLNVLGPFVLLAFGGLLVAGGPARALKMKSEREARFREQATAEHAKAELAKIRWLRIAEYLSYGVALFYWGIADYFFEVWTSAPLVFVAIGVALGTYH